MRLVKLGENILIHAIKKHLALLDKDRTIVSTLPLLSSSLVDQTMIKFNTIQKTIYLMIICKVISWKAGVKKWGRKQVNKDINFYFILHMQMQGYSSHHFIRVICKETLYKISFL